MKNYFKYFLIFILFLLVVLTQFWNDTSVLSADDNIPSAGPASGKGILDSLVGEKDRQPPHIELQELSVNRTVYTEQIYIEGKVTDSSLIETLALNNTSILNSAARSIVFSHLVNLLEGENTVTIKAIDAKGNATEKEITVYRENPGFSQLPKEIIEERMRIAVYPFEKNGTVTEESSLFMDLLVMALQKQNRFQLTDRSLMSRILEEQQLSLTHLVDQNAAVKMGRIMSAQAIIIGSIIDTGSGTELVGRIIDTETSEIMATEKTYSRLKGFEALAYLANAMAVQFHNDFPMRRGVVIKRTDRHIFTDLGRNAIPLRGRLIIYRENDSKMNSLILGYARITQVLPDMSKAELISGRLNEIREMDRVILQ